MDSYMGPTDGFVAAYLSEQSMHGPASTTATMGAHMMNGMSHAASSQVCAAAAARNGLFMGMNHLASRVKQEQDQYASLTSSKDSATTAGMAAMQAAGDAAAVTRQQQANPLQMQAAPAHQAAKFTSAFSLPTGMIPTPVTAAMTVAPAHTAISMDYAMAAKAAAAAQAQVQHSWFGSSSGGFAEAAAAAQQAAAAAQHAAVQQQAAAAQQQAQLFGAPSFGNAAGSFSSNAVGLPPAAALQAAAAASQALSFNAAARAHSQALSSSTAVPALPPDDEPDLSHLTVMQRYHARRKLAVQRMEREVEEKIAQLALLEQENRKLKWQAHILENMLVDIDKQLEVMAHSDHAPDASQWLTLLGMGQPSTGSKVARTVHKMLEGAGQVNITDWTVQECRRRWLEYLNQLRPLLEQAEAAQAEHRANQPAQQQEVASGSGGTRRPRRAAAAAAQAVIQQEAADVLGVVPVPPSNIPEPPAPLSSSPSAPRPLAEALQQQQQQPQTSASSDPGSEQGTAHAVSTEGIPAALLAQIEGLVLKNFYWLLAVMSNNPVLTYEFISMDLEEGTRPLPPQDDKLWADAVERVQPTVDQMQECSTCIQVSRRCMAKVMEERAEIQESMQCKVESEMHTHLSEDVLQLNSRDAAVDRMRANVRKESVVRNMVGFYCINVFSLYQLAQVSVACAPWFCMAWRVIGAMDEALTQQLADAARQGSRGGTGGSAHNTRSSARLGLQR